MEISIFSDIEEMSLAFFNFMTDEFTQALLNGKSYHLALSGGSTPLKIFQYLASKPLPFSNWEFLHLYWGDERCVPPDNEQSNYGNLWSVFLKDLNIPDENIHRIYGENDPEPECKRYTEVLKKYLPSVNGVLQFDLTLLGIGQDGHVASIFPGAEAPANINEICYASVHPQTMQKRITLSLKLINNSRCILFLAAGSDKAEIISKVIRNDPSSKLLPSALVKPLNGKLKWYLDVNAGKNIK